MRKILLDYLAHKFILKEIKNEYENQKVTIAWVLMIINWKGRKVEEVNWSTLCHMHNVNLINCLRYDYKETFSISEVDDIVKRTLKTFKNKNTLIGAIHFYSLLHEFYRWLSQDKQFIKYSNIQSISKYENLLINISSINIQRMLSSDEEKVISRNILSDFPDGSSYKDLFQVEHISNNQKKYLYNFNANTDDRSIHNLLNMFLNTFKKSDYLNNKFQRIFVYYFVESLYGDVVKGHNDFSKDIFITQYSYYKTLGRTLYKKGLVSDERIFKEILVQFYRYLLNSFEGIEAQELFDRKFIQSIFSKNFYKYYENGYEFIYHNRFEPIPKSDKFCILPSSQSLLNAYNKNHMWRGVDITDVPLKYKEKVKGFIWFSEGNIMRNIQYIHALIEFLNLKKKYDYNYRNILEFQEGDSKEFSEDFLWEYRLGLDFQSNYSGETIKGILKMIRRFLKLYADEYGVTSNDLEVLNLKGLASFKGGIPLTDSDSKVIYIEFERLELINCNGRLYTIVFELLMLTNLRFGEILNLKRDCIIEVNLKEGSGKLMYLSKKSNSEYITQNVSLAIIQLIKEAIELMGKYVVTNELMSSFIFIEPYQTPHIKFSKRINFSWYLKKIIKNVHSQLENKSYTPYNIRHTFINNVYKEGVKQNLSIPEMALISGNSYKSANLYYRKYGEIESYIETMAQVTISDVDINGNILPDAQKEYRKIVKNNLGNCKSSQCNFEIGECLLCTHFVTFPNRIPAFEQAICHYNEIIEKSTNHLEIQELSSQKKLLGKYLAEMYLLEDEKDE